MANTSIPWIKVNPIKSLYRVWDYYLQSYEYTYAFSKQQAYLQLQKKILSKIGKYNMDEVQLVK